MELKKNYEKKKKELLEDTSICKENRELFKKFFEYEERKLKRINGLRAVDNNSYKTLFTYLARLRSVNEWFKNKPWKDITKKEIEKVWNDLEDGKIKNTKGKPYKDKTSYYNKIMKSKPFQLAGKDNLVREVIEFSYKEKGEVRFFEEDTFKDIIHVVIQPVQKCLCWLAFDIGENIFTLLQLQKKDFMKHKNENNDYEYIVNLPQKKLKRSRTSRSEITNYIETTQLLDIILKDLKPNDKLFNFGERQATKFLKRAVNKTNAKCLPNGQSVSWKDFRSSMACFLLSQGWSSDEIKSRMGHKPSSAVLDKYVNYLALNRHEPKKKLFNHSLVKIKEELEQQKNNNKLLQQRYESIVEDIKTMHLQLEALKK